MKRNVVKHGASTLIVSLPAKWVKQYGVKQGDEIDVIEKGRSLLINPDSERSLSIDIDVTGMIPRLVDRLLARSYQKGFDEIHLTHNDVKLLDTVKSKVPELIGYEIMDQNQKTCTIKAITSKIELDFEQSLRRAFLIIQEMINEAISAYEDKDKTTLENVYLHDLEVNRLTYFCLRQINKEHYTDFERVQERSIIYYIIESMEDLGDACKKFAKKLSKSDLKNEGLLSVLKDLKKQLEISISYFYKPEKEKANQAYTGYKDIEKKVEEIVGKKDLCVNETTAIFVMLDAAHIIYHFTTMRLNYLAEANGK